MNTKKLSKMRQLIINLIILSFLTMLLGCGAITGEEIARLSINQVDTEAIETSVVLEKGEAIFVWSNMDLEFEGKLRLKFKMEILKEGEHLDYITIDPTDRTKLTLNQFRTSKGNKTKLSFSRRNAQINIPENGNYTFKAYLESRTSNLKIDKADLVLRR